MKKRTKYIFIAIVFFLIIEGVAYFIHPLAPVVVLLSVIIQLPIIFLVFKAKTGDSYEQRAQKRRAAFEQDNNAEQWLKAEQNEEKTIGFKYWSSAGKSLLALNQAEIFVLLEQPTQAANQLVQVKYEKLSKENQNRFTLLQEEIKQTKN